MSRGGFSARGPRSGFTLAKQHREAPGLGSGGVHIGSNHDAVSQHERETDRLLVLETVGEERVAEPLARLARAGGDVDRDRCDQRRVGGRRVDCPFGYATLREQEVPKFDPRDAGGKLLTQPRRRSYVSRWGPSPHPFYAWDGA